MRALLGLLVLGSLFVMAAAWQSRRTEELRDERERRYGDPSDVSAEGGRWSTLVLGRPSGAEPIPSPEEPVPPAYDPGEGVDWEVPSYPPDHEHEVAKGEILGKICDAYYGTSRPSLVDAVAKYNQLESADDIREGQVLRLPDRERLGQ